MNQKPLRFKISDWHQLSKCQSNNSRKLHISVSDFINDERLTGIRISVNHDDFGVLFACIINARGNIIDEYDNNDNIVIEFTPIQIINELAKYGFLVVYQPNKNLTGEQIDYLLTLDKLKYDKIRILNVYHYEHGVQVFKWYVVGFKVDNKKDWLNNAYSPSDKEFKQSLVDGSAINISAISKQHRWNWSWLYGYVANISDVLEDNA